MNENDKWYTDEVRKTFCKDRYSTTSHHYFFELKEAKNGSKYIVISQRKKVGNEFVGTKMRIFSDEMQGFQRMLDKFVQLTMHDETGASSIPSQPTAMPEFLQPQPIPIALTTPTVFNAIESPLINSQQGVFEKAKSRLQHLWGRSQPKIGHAEFQPGFFEKLLVTNNWREFEEYTYYLLKLIGIQNVYHFLGERQAGRADGFLKTGNLAILYDCTLRSGQVDADKHEQINNYCAQLQRGVMDISENVKEELYHHKKQVWIITKGTTRLIKTINTVEVKEINIVDIIAIYQERLLGNMNQHMLEMRLQNL
ncbi:hypothetical protein [Chromatium okenii]|jgi:hypothetical protein|uniref:Uncharacterized protein n=1 Tax=Chromatium okenii TaxID=61644 RepID=A0A2S7XRD2_9GAMM|nr:hypothetical protein [Chromatium okenii]PQJ95961.1 hypothetical protein CXB77_08890 [Chromatium okenii]